MLEDLFILGCVVVLVLGIAFKIEDAIEKRQKRRLMDVGLEESEAAAIVRQHFN